MKPAQCNNFNMLFDKTGISSWLELSFVDGLSWLMVLICCIIQIITIEIEKLIIIKCNGKI